MNRSPAPMDQSNKPDGPIPWSRWTSQQPPTPMDQSTTTPMDQSTPTPMGQSTNDPNEPAHHPDGLVSTNQWTILPPRWASPTTVVDQSHHPDGPVNNPRWTSQQRPRGTSPQPRWTSQQRPRRTSQQPTLMDRPANDPAGPVHNPDGPVNKRPTGRLSTPMGRPDNHAGQSNQLQRTNQQPQGTVDNSGEPLDIPAPRGKVACPDDPSPEDPTRSTPSVTKVSRGTTGFALPH
jgi:hypothetical protein